MDRPSSRAVPGDSPTSMQEELWLLGQPPLYAYLSYVKNIVLDGAQIPRSALVDEWREANDHYYELEMREAGCADAIEVFDLPPVLQPLADEVREDATYRRAFDTLPTRFAMVELERMVVAQPHINLTHTKRLRSRLSERPRAEEVFHFCHPLNNRRAEINVRRIGEGQYSFTSESSDFRFREAVLLQPDQIDGGERFGSSGVVLGLVVGFSSNFLTVIESEKRLLLHNGHHRAFALLEHGVTHAPCIIQTVTRRDELNLIAGTEVQEAPAFYFKAARPPLLKDFLDPRIRKLHKIPSLLQMVNITFEIQDHEVGH